MKTSEIRSRFLQYFESKGHTVVASSSLVPHNDPTLLFTNAGMNQFKDCFLGKEKRSYVRATSAQRCVRAGGKHNDLDNVGFTARHCTFFEMLGNFSFGDYFKKDAIHFAWDFITNVMQLPKDKLYVTVFETDDEAAEIWHKQEGVALDRIYRFGEKDNFWSMGDTGPCGPCTEIFIDRGEKYSCGKPTCAMGCSCDRFMEFWNLVFMQYDRQKDGQLIPLPKPAVDTGMGLERISLIVQNVDSVYEIDLFTSIIQSLSKLAGVEYEIGSKTAPMFRAIADHARSTTFLMSDGVMPSNEGRGYVLRRIMRRAIRLGRNLGFTGPFFSKVAGFVIDEMASIDPSLREKRSLIERATLAEEEQFLRTLDKGMSLLEDEFKKIAKGGEKGGHIHGQSYGTLPGEAAFKLYDTFGFPLDLTKIICNERDYAIDEDGFVVQMNRQRAESRKNWKGSGEQAIEAVYLKCAEELKARGELPTFVGYEKLAGDSKCVALILETPTGLSRVDQYEAKPVIMGSMDSEALNEVLYAVFKETPFYGESGGQTGDKGRIIGRQGDSGFEAAVVDVKKPVPELIVAEIMPDHGVIKVGQTYSQQTDKMVRSLTAANHTATHMLQWALREVLGNHVKQAGSYVGPDLLRFDFNHFQSLTEDELQKVESKVNEKIWASDTVLKEEMDKEAAVSKGAIAFFGEKYGDRVRVVQVGDYSTELCGGTHVDRSSDIHLFKIESETSIASGVRRMIAYTSKGAFQLLNGRNEMLSGIQAHFKVAKPSDVITKLEKLEHSEKELRKRLESLEAKGLAVEVESAMNPASGEKKVIQGVRVVIHETAFDDRGVQKLRDLTDALKTKDPNAIGFFAMKDAETSKVFLICCVPTSISKKVHAGNIIKQTAELVGGKGGGKPELAQAGGTIPMKMAEAMKLAESLISASLG